ncbi:MAG: septal ring lytic transglycosylase RlpA family protein [Candidatus Aquicultorales bacterium]
MTAKPSPENRLLEMEATKENIRGFAREIEESKLAMDSLGDKIAVVEKRKERLTVEFLRAEAEFKEKNTAYSRRVVAIYKDQEQSLAYFLGVRDFEEFMTRIRYLSQIAAADTRLVDELDSRRAQAKRLRDQAGIENAALLKIHQALAAERRRYERLLADASTRLTGLQVLYEQERQEAVKEMAKARAAVSLPLGTSPTLRMVPVRPHAELFAATTKMPASFRATGTVLRGVASWYGNEFHGRRTANGETYNQMDFTAASKELPFGTYLAVTYKGERVIVRVNDRGPYIEGRIIDLSKGAAQALGLGLGEVTAEIVVPE